MWRSQVIEAWHAVKWLWLVIVVAWLVLQTIALRRLCGDLKERGHKLRTAMLVLFIAVWSVQMVFENQRLDVLTNLIFGVACLGSIGFFTKMLGGQRHVRDRQVTKV
jgi:hypothetical protein